MAKGDLGAEFKLEEGPLVVVDVVVPTTTTGLAGIGAAFPIGVETTTGRAEPAARGRGGLGGSPVDEGPAGVSMAKRCSVQVVHRVISGVRYEPK